MSETDHYHSVLSMKVEGLLKMHGAFNVWYYYEALSPLSHQKWFTTSINWKLILFDVPDNGGKN